ncbi:DUF6434 domain-containing protein [Flammeovirga aprica]|uniref:DUF6434 domain-containing protein n=1 Tax=Flammeovirga aprica JL-4 TaxID=694437 RepID=A0A7X9RZG2_9BACT|nr:DUF6434 domain-containing protein [Flammeovirga aprica]NME71598.1 hypothetical protein [Flammeovirga aprica JL-4]
MDSRPILNKKITLKDFKEFYWLKEELVTFCRSEGLKTTGGKVEISERIEFYLKTGLVREGEKKKAPKSKFDWNTEVLSLQTIITDNYKNTENVRNFMLNHIGQHFKFNVKFMNWMKVNTGKSLADAVSEWKSICTKQKTTTEIKSISPQFEYNTYLRDFLVDNPTLKRDIGIKLWNIKKTLRGDTKYSKEDLKLLKKEIIIN